MVRRLATAALKAGNDAIHFLLRRRGCANRCLRRAASTVGTAAQRQKIPTQGAEVVLTRLFAGLGYAYATNKMLKQRIFVDTHAD
ncbi:hypothetical protein [Nostoc sp.]|uniref:hypothetical protein n=1 Tax=Nostoc sp. TaxID=1180 RepID=UPI002FFC0A4F